ncbi:cache domain-containing sensor histidine kinase [Paenibacillus endoradicis]|uniref:cache domain-containing sensor histidine kinase n=1 Tax=Paenibacillus endoradicis TaxID=2972487 RepID=UPI0021597EE3|nr:sensor histidine kinase [Paenibacillus endoradicis]MCR8655854.1 sensor histidine kinase [Paenibacillus endoradicis]MCR8658180.1 sensor histidine kinase [Paenibacillus endoradicis]
MLSKFLARLDNVRIKQKLFVSFIVVAFVPIIFVGVYLTSQFRQHVLEQATEQSNNNVERIKLQLESTIQRPIDISGILMSDANLSNVINTQYESTYEVVKAFQDYSDFREYLKLYNEISNIKFYSSNKTLLDNWEFMRLTDEITESSWYDYTNHSGLIYWAFIADETKKNQSYLSLVRKVEFPLYRTNGILVMNISPDVLNNIVRQETFDTYIIDSLDTIVAAKDHSLVGQRISELDFASERINWGVGQYEMKVNGEPSRIIVEELLPQYSQNSLKIMSIFRIDSIVSGADRISYQGLIVMLISIIISMILIYATSSLISKRILALNRHISKVSTGDLNVNSDITGNDEIGLLSRQFNNMVGNIRDLMDRVRDTEYQKSQLELRQREIKLKMMASQINPHFLFNALESIRMNAHMKGEKELAGIVRMLGKMIRKNLEVGSGSISMADEIEVIRCYLEIQKFRFGPERLAFTLDVDESALEQKVPPLLIQPIVENAVVHGLDQVIVDGKIHISIQYHLAQLRVVITDNGQGMDIERLQQVMQAISELEEENGSRIGLRNVHQRLVMTYGVEAGLQINSQLGEGTSVSFAINMEEN